MCVLAVVTDQSVSVSVSECVCVCLSVCLSAFGVRRRGARVSSVETEAKSIHVSPELVHTRANPALSFYVSDDAD